MARILVLFILWFSASLAGAQEVTLGVTDFPADANLLLASHPALQLIRRDVAGGLTEAAKGVKLPYKLALADMMSVTGVYDTWSFRLRRDATFSNGRAVRSDDVVYSLGRCRKSGILPGVAGLEGRHVALGESGSAEEWIDIHLDRKAVDPLRIKDFPLTLAACPIIERASSALFGELLGTGTDLIGAGDYYLAGGKKDRELVVLRVSPKGTGPASVTIRAMKDEEHALSALRAGTIDAFYSRDEDIAKRVRADETLLLDECSPYNLVRRRGFTLRCGEAMSLSKLRYE